MREHMRPGLWNFIIGQNKSFKIYLKSTQQFILLKMLKKNIEIVQLNDFKYIEPTAK